MSVDILLMSRVNALNILEEWSHRYGMDYAKKAHQSLGLGERSGLYCSREIRLQVVGDGISHVRRHNFWLEVASDVKSVAADGQVGLNVRVKFGDGDSTTDAAHGKRRKRPRLKNNSENCR